MSEVDDELYGLRCEIGSLVAENEGLKSENKRLRDMTRKIAEIIRKMDRDGLIRQPVAPPDADFEIASASKFADNMRKIAKHRGLTQREMCRKAGITWSSWKNWVFQGMLPQTRTLLEVCDALDCTPNDLLRGMYGRSGR